MSAWETINDWLGRLNPSDRGLLLDHSGACRLKVGNAGECSVLVPASDSAVYYLYAELAALPEKPAPALYEAVLNLNVPGTLTAGSVVGLDQQHRSLVLSYAREISATDVHAFCVVLNNFCVAMADAKSRIDRLLGPQRSH